jgi:hypothetical protein
MAHGYLQDYDDGWTTDDSRRRERDEDRGRNSRGEHGDRNRNFMFDDRGRDADRSRDRFREGDRQWRGSHQDRWSSSDWRGSGEDGWRSGQEHSAFSSGSDDWDRSGRNFRSHQDDHYRSWRDRQMADLDRDYADYCREREQQFHRDFGEWRQRRSGNPQPLRTGMTQTGLSHDPSGEYQLRTESTAGPIEPDAVSDATLGTNSAEGPAGGGQG